MIQGKEQDSDTREGTRGHSLKLSLEHARTNVRKESFSLRVTRLWNDLLEVLKDTPLDKARILNAQFSSVFTKESPLNTLPQEADPIRQYAPISKLNITTEGIKKLLENLNPNKAMGPDRLHPRVLKETARAVAPILQIIFSKSLENGEVPDNWKQANIAPIFKKGERYCPSNYRPVSLTCVCSKLMEHIISKHLLNHLEANNILFDKQHGFRKKRSTDTQLLAFTQDILANLSGGRQTDVIIMDFAKAFDKVPHHRLIQKLERYGITGPVNIWIETLLKDRKQRVAYEGIYSDWAPVIS